MTSQEGLIPASTHCGVSHLLLWGSCPLWERGRPLPALGRAQGPRAPATLRPARAPRICSEDIECSGLTIPKAVQYLSSQDEKCQAIGAYYIQHTCFQDESAKQQVSSRGPGGSLNLPQAGGEAFAVGSSSPCPATQGRECAWHCPRSGERLWRGRHSAVGRRGDLGVTATGSEETPPQVH